MSDEVTQIKPSYIFDLFNSILSNMEFFKFPRYEAFQHSFRLLEGIESDIHFGPKTLDELFATQQKFEDTKKYLIYWIYTKCPEGGRYIWTDKTHIEKTIPAITLARNFSLIHDSIVAAQKNWATLFLYEKKRLIEFKYLDQKKGLLFARNLFDRFNWQKKKANELNKEMENIKGLKNAINQLSETVHITTDNELRYSTNELINDSFEKSVKAALKIQQLLDESWSLGSYSINDFKSIWVQIYKLSLIHQFAYLISFQKYGNYDVGYNNSLFSIRKSGLIDYLRKYTQKDKSIIEVIIQDLIYDHKIRHMDIIYQPLIEIDQNKIYFSPNLIQKSLIDRNLQVLLTKLPHRKKEYDRLKNLKEDKMIGDISPFFKKYGFKFESKIVLKENKRKITDIDLLIWDKTYKDFLVVQLKWFYGADSTQEVSNHDGWFNEGILKTKKSIEYIKNNFDTILSKLDIPQTKSIKNIYGFILSKTGTPSPFIDDPNFPVIEELDFFEIIKKCNGRIQNLYQIILAFFMSKKRIRGIKESSFEVKVEDYKFILPAIEY